MIVLYICMQIMFQIEHVQCYVGFFQVECWIFLCFGNFKLYIWEKKNLHFRLAMAVQHSTVPIALINLQGNEYSFANTYNRVFRLHIDRADT